MAENKHDDFLRQFQQIIDDYVIAHRKYYCALLCATPSENVALAYDADAINFIANAKMEADIPDDMRTAFTIHFNDSLNAYLNEEYADILNDAVTQALTDAFRDCEIGAKH